MAILFTLTQAAIDEQKYWEAVEAWREWQIYSCIERHGKHLWQVSCEPDDSDFVDIHCEYCLASLDDIAPDGIDLVFGNFYGITIENGIHNSKVDVEIPVDVKVHSVRHGYFGAYEYDYWVELISRGTPNYF